MDDELSQQDGFDSSQETGATSASGVLSLILSQMRAPLAIVLRELFAVTVNRYYLTGDIEPDRELKAALQDIAAFTRTPDDGSDNVSLHSTQGTRPELEDTWLTTREFEDLQTRHLTEAIRHLAVLADLVEKYSEPAADEEISVTHALAQQFSELRPSWRARMIETASGIRKVRVARLSAQHGTSTRSAQATVSRRAADVPRADARRLEAYRNAFTAGERSDGLDDSKQDSSHPLADDDRPSGEA